VTGPQDPAAVSANQPSANQPGDLAPGAASSVDSPATSPSGGTKDASHQTPVSGSDVATTTVSSAAADSASTASRALAEPTGPDLAPLGVERTGMFGVHGTGDTSGFGLLVKEPYTPVPAERPYGGYFDEVADALAAAMIERSIPSSALIQTTVANGEITFYFSTAHLSALFWALRDDPSLKFELASSISGVDYGPGVLRRLHVVYELTSMTYRRRIRIEVAVGINDPHVPSAVATYPTADWHERETWDMFGIIFDGHPGLTRILMPDDWDGHPQRKDYPLGGIPVEYKGAEIPAPDQRRTYS
jgi:NADH-quinone oxidoreductase subunit C